ncbi:MAG: hypothetical protein MRZ90_06345 [Candidatus Gastranaerophilales bacterium]|nr:hypothetical protein [Candidatus Gastranaerophilales bacterium]
MKIQTLYPVSFYGNNKKNNITNNKKEQQNIILNNKETDKKNEYQTKYNDYLKSEEPDMSKKAMNDGLMILFLQHNKMI